MTIPILWVLVVFAYIIVVIRAFIVEEGNDRDRSCKLSGTCSTTNAQVPDLFKVKILY